MSSLPRRIVELAQDMDVVVPTEDGERPITDDERSRYLADAGAWWQAASLAELGHLTADWLEGKNLYLPAYCATGPDAETRDLIPTLAAANRAGFVTHSSQPGHGPTEGHDGRMWLQRAFVSGFADLHTAASLESAFEGNENVIFWANKPGPAPRAPKFDHDYFAVTLRARDDTAESGLYDVNTCAGLGPSRTDLKDDFHGIVGRSAYEQLRQAWYVTIADRQYCEDGTLWKLLAEWAAQRGAAA